MGYPMEHRTEDRRADDPYLGHEYDDDTPADDDMPADERAGHDTADESDDERDVRHASADEHAAVDDPEAAHAAVDERTVRAGGDGAAHDDEFGAEPDLVRPYTDRAAAGVGPDDVAQGRAHVPDEARANVTPGEDATAADEAGSGDAGTPAAATPAAVTTPPATTPDGDGALWDADAARRYRDQWRDLQIGFVDDPANAVQQARALVDKVTDEFRSAVSRRLESLSGNAADGDPERQRTTLRAYREVFDRLLG